MLSQVLALLSDTGRRGQTLLSVPKHSQTSQDAVETPPRRPRGLQDRSKTPKLTPKAHPRSLMLEPRELQKTNKNMWFLLIFRKSSLFTFTFCSMLIKNGLKISSRSLQERSQMPQDVQRPPTWGQHGPNMGPTWGPRGLQDRSKGGQIALPRGSAAPIAVRPPP